MPNDQCRFTKTSEGEWKQQLLRHAFTASNAIKYADPILAIVSARQC